MLVDFGAALFRPAAEPALGFTAAFLLGSPRNKRWQYQAA